MAKYVNICTTYNLYAMT